jgi:hypothetical protein
MFKKIIDWVKAKQITVTLEDPIKPTHKTVQSDIRDEQAKKRFNKYYDQQEQNVFMRALKQHDPTCPDHITCDKNPCFIRVADKIVATYIVDAKTKERIE